MRAVSHITGGGFYENIPRALAAGCVAKLEKKSLRMPPIFPLLQKVGKIPERDMFNTFNMGVGMGCRRARRQGGRIRAHPEGSGRGCVHPGARSRRVRKRA